VCETSCRPEARPRFIEPADGRSPDRRMYPSGFFSSPILHHNQITDDLTPPPRCSRASPRSARGPARRTSTPGRSWTFRHARRGGSSPTRLAAFGLSPPTPPEALGQHQRAPLGPPRRGGADRRGSHAPPSTWFWPPRPCCTARTSFPPSLVVKQKKDGAVRFFLG